MVSLSAQEAEQLTTHAGLHRGEGRVRIHGSGHVGHHVGGSWLDCCVVGSAKLLGLLRLLRVNDAEQKQDVKCRSKRAGVIRFPTTNKDSNTGLKTTIVWYKNYGFPTVSKKTEFTGLFRTVGKPSNSKDPKSQSSPGGWGSRNRVSEPEGGRIAGMRAGSSIARTGLRWRICCNGSCSRKSRANQLSRDKSSVLPSYIQKDQKMILFNNGAQNGIQLI